MPNKKENKRRKYACETKFRRRSKRNDEIPTQFVMKKGSKSCIRIYKESLKDIKKLIDRKIDSIQYLRCIWGKDGLND